MELKTFKKCMYSLLGISILMFYTRDCSRNKFYRNIKIIKNTNEIDLLVNKNNKLPNNYIPNNLVKLNVEFSNKDKYMVKEAAKAFESLSKTAKNLNYKIIAASTYRNYEYQKNLYNGYIKSKGKKYADLCSARPGHSEHQTGLAVDVMGSNNNYNEFENSIEFNWMKRNAYKYGFILRYPKSKENITGFKYEPWHYRYVGKKIAYLMYKKDITLEEYYKTKKKQITAFFYKYYKNFEQLPQSSLTT